MSGPMQRQDHDQWEERYRHLVQGDLPAREHHALVAELDRQPQRWRDFALWLLEEQVLQAELKGWFEPFLAKNPAAAPRRKERRSGFWSPTVQVLALAASILLAFAAGRMSGGVEGSPSDGQDQVVTAPTAPAPVTNTVQGSPGTIELVMPDRGGRQQRVRVPVVQLAEPPDEEWVRHWLADPPAPPPWLPEADRPPQEFQYQRQLVTLQRDDGHIVVVPVDRWQVVSPVRY